MEENNIKKSTLQSTEQQTMKKDNPSEVRSQTIPNKIIRRTYWNWMFFNLSVQNFERMEGPALIRMLGRVREDLYPNQPEKQKEMLARHANFFNTEPYLGCLVPGIVTGMEYEMAKGEGGDVSPELINSFKTALMGPLAGIGDSLLPGTLIPILLSIALGLSQNGSILGPLFYVVVFLGIMLPLTYFLFSSGAKAGAKAAEDILNSGIKDQVVAAAEIVGLMVIGAVTAQYTHVNIGWVFQNGELEIKIGEILNSIMPGLPVLLLVLLTYWLMIKKNWGALKVIGLYAVLSVVGYFIGMFVV
ncbi:MAG: PTS system mannose/fructose/sorbose family transporter subunit IID [Peptoniphilaceae bacterium]|nr:PTS system mannose/fructose/sorbose family transporter subunit IID [Peptoniphilaceae bacterium]MCI6660235.1 PTS system mannose/fructose/sorbose family transporter subunit IID [Peptoniphilaceae bacterium]MDD7433692.1 PTS system mannose/fructose/sorbose family transporter subunit IID [Peptoniphilaceae bacterium]MDY3075528.1 PTS system mannose/fructose/sorbose family transporter subunit IID [Peptoniphilaceae bacterium]MDY3987525.1 PTS system mannose/fructose/sorbose family transporter subunit I